jgi:Mannosyl-glycoprotein endo-beta-N-acetylglucosaminidase
MTWLVMMRSALAVLLVSGLLASSTGTTSAASFTPEIRLSADNRVPTCVTPDRLMRYVVDRNPNLDPRFRDIAKYFKFHGEALRVRWDYAFFQTLLETNYLAFKRSNGEAGDVKPHQNNFAGIGATGRGAPGDSFADISSGVLAQMQHLVVYSGERIDSPLAPRTRAKQDEIVAASRSLNRPVRFADLTKRWAADRNYAREIETIAEGYRNKFCPGAGAEADPSAGQRAGTQIGAPAPFATRCRVSTASYGGTKTLLIRSATPQSIDYTVLKMEAGKERTTSQSFTRTAGSQTIGVFASEREALARAYELCPDAG